MCVLFQIWLCCFFCGLLDVVYHVFYWSVFCLIFGLYLSSAMWPSWASDWFAVSACIWAVAIGSVGWMHMCCCCVWGVSKLLLYLEHCLFKFKAAWVFFYFDFSLTVCSVAFVIVIIVLVSLNYSVFCFSRADVQYSVPFLHWFDVFISSFVHSSVCATHIIWSVAVSISYTPEFLFGICCFGDLSVSWRICLFCVFWMSWWLACFFHVWVIVMFPFMYGSIIVFWSSLFLL